MKDVFSKAGLPMSKYTWFYDCDYKNDSESVLADIKKLKFPVIVKPSATGSSVGIKVADNIDELKEAIDDAMQYDDKILVEEVVPNLKECNISVVGNYEHQKVSEIEEVISASKFLTYEEKYIGGGKKVKGGYKIPVKNSSKGMASTNRKLPAEISDKIRGDIEDIAVKAFRSLGSAGVCRIDFLIDEKAKKVYINEINSIPGSLSFYLWEAKGVNFSDLLDDLINIGVKNYKKRISKTHSFDTNILKGFAANGGVKGMKGMKGKLR